MKILTDNDFLSMFKEPIEYLACDKGSMCYLTERSADCEEIIIKTVSHLYHLKFLYAGYDIEGKIAGAEINDYDKELFPYVVKSKNDYISFTKLVYDEDEFWGLKFSIDDRLLYIFVSQDNLIITKTTNSIDEPCEIGDDDSVLFE